MSEAVAKSGKLITIGPFGGHRVPDLLRQWPAELQAVTEFQPINSMEFFQSFETTAPEGKDGLDLVFIDGNHQFAYAAIRYHLSGHQHQTWRRVGHR
jgi:hypothetical protein